MLRLRRGATSITPFSNLGKGAEKVRMHRTLLLRRRRSTVFKFEAIRNSQMRIDNNNISKQHVRSLHNLVFFSFYY